MTIQDAHTHFFSRAFFEDLARASPRPDSVEDKLAAVVERTGLELPEPDPAAHARRWLAAMDAHGVERMVTFASLPSEAPAVAEGARVAGGRLLPYTLVDPTAEGAAGFARRALGELGFRGLLTFPALHRFDPSDPRCDPVYAVAREHGAPVIVHCGVFVVKLRDLLGLPRPYDLAGANPLRVVPAANRFPEIPFVLPHFGGGFLREALMAGLQCENVWVDSSSSNDWMRTDPGGLDLAAVFRAALDVFGPERILFGTDSSTFPRGWRADVLAAQREALAAAGAGADAQAAILGGNLARLLPPRETA